MQSANRIKIFLEVAKLQSFAKAAHVLGMTGPAASKQVMALEEELGVKLLHRTTRMVTLTDEGAMYYERALHAVEELKEAAEQLRDMKSSPAGVLKINAPVSFGLAHLRPVLSAFAKKYPDVTMDISFEDRMVDVMAEGYDMVIRIGALVDSTLISKPLGECPILVVASPDYIREHGRPRIPSELRQHRLVTYSHQGAGMEWRYRDTRGKIGTVRGDGHFRANSADMMLQAALDGIGIAILPEFVIADDLKDKRLVQLLSEYETYPGRVITALMPPNRYRSHKVKLLLDWLVRCSARI